MQTVAICDQNYPDPILLEDGIKAFARYEQLLEEQLDVLFVSLPNYLSPEVTIAGLEKGLHVFCEKPPAKDVAGIESVIEVEKRHPELILKYGFNHRYHHSVREAIRIIDSGELGSIVNLRGVYGKSKIIPFSGGWRAQRKYSGGGILLDQGIHLLDLMRMFCGEFVEVKSLVSNDYWGHDVEDNVFALLKNQEGGIATIHSSATQWQHRFALDIALTEGYLELHGILSGSKSYGEEKLTKGYRDESDKGAAREEVTVYLEDTSWQDEIQEFADVVISGKKMKYGSSADALATMKLVYEIYWADPKWRESFEIERPS
tara:strand:- start:2650 stop:3600 length:951 start_codon:yes stop_codon:yes gene_type:complete